MYTKCIFIIYVYMYVYIHIYCINVRIYCIYINLYIVNMQSVYFTMYIYLKCIYRKDITYIQDYMFYVNEIIKKKTVSTKKILCFITLHKIK